MDREAATRRSIVMGRTTSLIMIAMLVATSAHSTTARADLYEFSFGT
jgi:hypothetical protein